MIRFRTLKIYVRPYIILWYTNSLSIIINGESKTHVAWIGALPLWNMSTTCLINIYLYLRLWLPRWLSVRICLTMQEMQVQYLGQKDLEKEMVSQSNILAGEISWTEDPGGLQSKGLQRVRHDLETKQTSPHFYAPFCKYWYSEF